MMNEASIPREMMSMLSNEQCQERICVASTKSWGEMETFIETHVRRLPFAVSLLTGTHLDRNGGGTLLSWRGPVGIVERRLGKVRRRWLHRHQSRFLRERGIRAVLGEYGHRGGVRMMRACEETGVPLVVQFHGFDVYNDAQVIERYKTDYQKLFSSAAALIGVSRSMCRRLEDLGAPPERIQYIPYYVDPDQFSQCMPAEEPVFLFVGRFVDKKAPHITLRSFAAARELVGTARLEMIGDGILLQSCRDLAQRLGVSNAVTFHGAQDHEFVRRAMLRTRCYVQHSVKATNGDSEGTPVSILEAQCRGLPVVSTRHAGIADVVDEGKTGFLVDEGDVDAMAEAMIRLASDYNAAVRLGEAAAARIRRVFGYDQTLGKLADVIRSTWEKRPKPGTPA